MSSTLRGQEPVGLLVSPGVGRLVVGRLLRDLRDLIHRLDGCYMTYPQVPARLAEALSACEGSSHSATRPRKGHVRSEGTAEISACVSMAAGSDTLGG
jgi:hypothetical protein